MEQYLIDQYNVFENEKYLTHEGQIVEYFSEDVNELFECGQGYYEDEVEKIVKVGNKFYHVRINAEIDSSKQDRGDRFYWVEGIKSVKYQEIPKPLPKLKEKYEFVLELSDDQLGLLKNFLDENKIDYNYQ